MSHLRPQASFATALLLSAILFILFAWPAIRLTTTSTRLMGTQLAANSTGVLGPGQRLTAGQAVVSASGQYRLAMQGDGNLVEYTSGRALWSTGSWGHPGAWAVMQGDGNFVVYTASGKALWNTQTGGHRGSSLSVQGDANLVVYSPAGSALWASNAVNSTLAAGERLQPGWSLQSPDRHYRLLMQGDGNLVEYTGGGFALWWTATAGRHGASAVLQGDGNFVVYSSSGVALWNTRTGGHPGTRLSIQADVSIVVSNTANGVLWSSLPTNRKPPAGLAGQEWNVLPTTQKIVALTSMPGRTQTESRAYSALCASRVCTRHSS